MTGPLDVLADLSVLAVMALHMTIGLTKLIGFPEPPTFAKIWRLRNYVVQLEDDVYALDKLLATEDVRVEAQLTSMSDEISSDLVRIADHVKRGDYRTALHEIEVLNDRVLDRNLAPSARSLYQEGTPYVVAYAEQPHSEVFA